MTYNTPAIVEVGTVKNLVLGEDPKGTVDGTSQKGNSGNLIYTFEELVGLDD